MLVVAFGGSDEDRLALEGIAAAAGWSFRHVSDAKAAAAAAVVICDAECFRDLIGRVDAPVIVASTCADERLWAEVLNLGGFDVLSKPFDRKEVLWAVELAHAHGPARTAP
jgi:DNA-binding response OmpR family regulator